MDQQLLSSPVKTGTVQKDFSVLVVVDVEGVVFLTLYVRTRSVSRFVVFQTPEDIAVMFDSISGAGFLCNNSKKLIIIET